MSTKRFFLALAIMAISFGSTMNAANSWTSIFSPVALQWNAFECAGGGNETFTNIPTATSTSYSTRTWTGENSVAWSSTDSRTDQTLNGKAIAMRTGVLTNTSAINGGVGTLSFNYKRVFTGNSTLKVFVNGTQYGGDITVSLETTSVFSQAINVSGPVTIELRNSGNRIIVDDLTWNCYDAAPAGPEFQLANASGTNVNCGELTLDFGSQAVNVSGDAVFTIRNTGTTALTVSSLALSNTTDFSVISPSAFPLTIAPSASTIVLVRFQSATSGNKTSVLTINNDDANEGACTVNLKGTALVPCAAPVVENGNFDFDALTAYSVSAAINKGDAQSYIVVISTSNTLGAAPVNGTTYNVGNTIGAGSVAYVGSAAAISLANLTPNTQYFVFLFPYNTTDCTGGPVYYSATSISSTFTTQVAVCSGANETFANIGTASSTYSNRTWTGDNGWQWNATDSRNDQTLNSKAITLRNGTLKNTTPVYGGIGTLSFSYKRVFNDNSTLKVFVNGVQYGGDITVSSETPSTFTYDIDLDAPVTIELVNSGNRTVIDDLTWNCYEIPNRPEIQLVDGDLNEKGCGDFNVDFGTLETGSDFEYTFTIKNKGLQNLEISSITFDDANYVITSPGTPVTIPALGVQDVVVIFNSSAAGTYPATLTIESNDTNEASCTINFAAKTLNACTTPVITAANTVVSNQTSSSLDVQVTGVTANGYVAFYTTAGGSIDPAFNGVEYTQGDVSGAVTVGYVGTASTFTIDNLSPETTYTIAVYPFNNTECINGPSYSESSLSAEGTTTVFICTGGTETFTNTGTNSTAYSTRSWTGDNGIDWTATDSRNDQTENGKAITLRTGSVKNTEAILGGVGTVSFNYKRVFTGNSTLKLLVNGVQYGGDITVSSDVAAPFSFAVNVSADATIELVNSGNRTVIDDLTWTCYESAARTALAKNKNNVAQVTEVSLYPNPNNGQFQISLVTETADVMVYDSLGKVVVSKTVSNNEMIDLSAASKGIYMVVITAGNDVTSKKVIIK